MKRTQAHIAIVGFFLVLQACSDTDNTSDELPSLVQEERVVQANLEEGYAINQLDSSEVGPLVSYSSDTIESGKILPIEKTVSKSIPDEAAVTTIPVPIQRNVNTASRVRTHALESQTYDLEQFEILTLGEDTSTSQLLNSVGQVVETNTPVVIAEVPVVADFPIPVRALPGKKRDQSYLDNLYWDIDQGLSSSHLFKIYQDSRDHIWFGTRDGGAVRYDGNNYTQFGSDEGLTDGMISDIEEDERGNIWFSTGDGIYIFDGAAFTHFSEEDGIGTATCMAIAKGHHGEMWVTTFGAGLLRIELQGEGIDRVELTHYSLREGLVLNHLWPVTVDSDGHVWIGYYHGGLAKIALDEQGYFASILNYQDISIREKSAVFDIVQLTNDRMAFSTNFGVIILHQDNNHIEVQEISDAIGADIAATRDLFLDTSSNILWAGTDRGLVKIDLGSDSVQLQTFSTNEGLSGNDVRSVFIDKKNNLWVGTKNAGVNLFHSSGFRHLTVADDITYVGIKSIIQNEDGDVYVLSPSGLTTFKNAQFLNDPTVEVQQSLEYGPYTLSIALAQSPDGAIYAGGYHGLYRVENGEQQYFAEEAGMLGHRIEDLIVHSNGKVYISMYDRGINELDYRSKDDFTISSLTYLNGMPGTLYQQLEEDNHGGIWIGYEKGISVYYPTEDGTDSIFHLSEAEGLSSNYITTIFKDASGDIWLGTDLGVNYVRLDKYGKPESIKYFTVENGLATNRVRSVAQDQNDRIWVATAEGLSVISNYQDQSTIKTFGKKEGLISVDFSPKSILVDRHNKLWLGSNHALTILDLNEFELKQESPIPAIDYLSIGEKAYNFHDSAALPQDCYLEEVEKFRNLPLGLSLPHQMNHVQIHFSSTEWVSPSKIRYSYRIKELNEPWSTPTKQNFADYRGLQPGSYTFELIAVGADHVWSAPIEYAFEIRPPWWMTTEAKVVYVILSIVLMFLVVRWRTYALKKRQKELEQDIAAATNEIRQQRDEISAHHKEVQDSIAYAKRIQSAILPPNKLVKNYLKDSFILYKPKDVVAGDFYWMAKKDDELLIAAADCTGHGVPGAMVSVICNGGLNRSVNEFDLKDPGQILDKTRELVIKEFEKSEDEVKDGMDIALCSIQDRRLLYAGAHNPLWIIRKGSDEVEQIKADKQPIGKYAKEAPFSTHSIQLQPGDTFYLFTDGYADQFGGENLPASRQGGKKFKAANFKRLLLSIQHEPMDRQMKLIDKAFEEWKGSLEQVDDVCVIGIRV